MALEKQMAKKYICYATTNGTLIQGEIKKWVIEIKAGLH